MKGQAGGDYRFNTNNLEKGLLNRRHRENQHIQNKKPPNFVCQVGRFLHDV